ERLDVERIPQVAKGDSLFADRLGERVENLIVAGLANMDGGLHPIVRRTERRGPAAKRFERDRPIGEYGFDQFGQFLFRMGGPRSLGSRSALQSAGLSGPLPFRRPARFQLVGD